MLFWKRKQVIAIPEIIEVGDVVIETATGAVGVLNTIAFSPYFTEERQGVVRGYVVFEDSADWLLVSEITLVAKAATLTATAIA